MRLSSVDVAVVGGGPAGCATALALRQNFSALSVALIEARGYTDHRPGEILPPAARSLLNSLQILHLLDRQSALRSCGVAFAWGNARREEKYYSFSARGSGWHLDRNRFDLSLADTCALRGVQVLRGTALQRAERRPAGWELLAGGMLLAARFVVDATGRAAVFARMQGERILFDDTLTSYSHIFANAAPSIAETWVESAPMGWWYTAPLPRGRRVVSFMTDVDLGRELGLPANDSWALLAQQTIHTASAMVCAEPVSDCIVRPASSARLSHTCGDGWLATGDASAAYDPLAAQGITKALHNGILAAYTAGDVLLGRERVAVARYAAILRAQFNQYRSTHQAHFARETRWSDLPFWARRRAATELSLVGAPS